MAAGPTYEPISTTTGNGSSTQITFNSIPQTYTDLVLVCSDINVQTQDAGLRFNNDSASNYSRTILYADLSGGPGSFRNTNQTQAYTIYRDLSSSTDKLVYAITNIMNYTNTTTNKTLLTRTTTVGGVGPNTTMVIAGSWSKTPEAITRIDIFSGLTNFSPTCKFTLYGIKAA